MDRHGEGRNAEHEASGAARHHPPVGTHYDPDLRGATNPLGVHGSNEGSRGKVLVVMSASDKLHLAEGKERTTGFFLPELGTPLLRLLHAGYDVTFASPGGVPPKMDPMSESLVWFMGSVSEREKVKVLMERVQLEKNFKAPRALSSLTDAELDEYCGVFIPGGHAPMEDLWKDADLGRILLHFHNHQKPTGAICHGPIALLSTRQAGSEFAYAGYKGTVYSNVEEKMNEWMWWSTVPMKAETALKEAGMEINVTWMPMGNRVVVDRELITAQNPSSSQHFANEFIKNLNHHTDSLRGHPQPAFAAAAAPGTHAASARGAKGAPFPATAAAATDPDLIEE